MENEEKHYDLDECMDSAYNSAKWVTISMAVALGAIIYYTVNCI
jgi:hypothetical protein